LMIAPWEVCPANTPREKYIAIEKNIVSSRVEAEAPGAVPGNKEDAKSYAAKVNLRGLLNQKIRLYRLRFQIKSQFFEKVRIGHERNTIFVKSDLAAECPFDFGCIVEMVDMTVSDQQQIKSYPKIPDPIRGPGWRINQNVSTGRLNQVGVGIENTANKSLKVKHSE